jgi:hypothetical protein
MIRALGLTFLAALGIGAATVAPADTPPRPASRDPGPFIQRFSGEWRGTGHVLIGPENGLKFHCALEGDPSRSQLTFAMRGKCWTKQLSAAVHARVRYNADTDRFYGAFMDGAQGDGADIVGERTGDGFFLKLSRGKAQGRVLAEPVGEDRMKVVISIHDRVNNRDVPVAAMGFARAGAAGPPSGEASATGSLSRAE